MPILITPHTPYILVIVQVIRIIHLLDRLYPLREEATHLAVLSFAVLAETTAWACAFADHVAPLVALVADCTLWAAVAVVPGGEAEETSALVQTCVVMMPYFFASEASDIAFEVSEQLYLLFRMLLLLCLHLHLRLRPTRLLNLHH